MATAKTAYDVEAEIRQLWQKYFDAADDDFTGNPSAHLLTQLLSEIGQKEIEYKKELAEDEQLSREQEEALAYQLFYKITDLKISSYIEHISKSIFDKEFTEKVFENNKDGKTSERQAEEWLEEKNESLQKMANGALAETQYNNLVAEFGTEKALKIIEESLTFALTCDNEQLKNIKDLLSKNEITPEQAQKMFLELTKELEGQTKDDFYSAIDEKAEEQRRAAIEGKVKEEGFINSDILVTDVGGAKIKVANEADFIRASGLKYTINGEEVDLNENQARAMFAHVLKTKFEVDSDAKFSSLSSGGVVSGNSDRVRRINKFTENGGDFSAIADDVMAALKEINSEDASKKNAWIFVATQDLKGSDKLAWQAVEALAKKAVVETSAQSGITVLPSFESNTRESKTR